MHNATGHLTWLGWMTFVLYLAAALLCFRTAKPCRSRETAGEGRVWSWLGVILAALGLNKPVDLQTLLIELGRHVAGDENLRAGSARLHVLFFLGFALVFIVLIVAVIIRGRTQMARFVRRQPLAAGGCVLICIYIVIRAVSITRMDLMLGFNFERIPFLWLLEAGGLALIIIQALQLEIRKQKS